MPKITGNEYAIAEFAGNHAISPQLREIRAMKPGDHIKVSHEGLSHSPRGNSCTIRLMVFRVSEAAKGLGKRRRYTSNHSPDGRTVYIRCELVPKEQKHAKQ